eukprot:1085455-Pelagomonas_calceolata.AAC.6
MKFTSGCPDPSSAPPVLKLGLSRWPAWPAQRFPCPATRHACQGKTFKGGCEFGWLGGAQLEADVSWYQARPPHAHGTAPAGMGSPSTLMLMQLLSPGPGSRLADKMPMVI